MVAFTKQLAELCAVAIEAIGILSISFVVVWGIIVIIKNSIKNQDIQGSIVNIRQFIGRGILLGLELLMAADIIHTVAVELTFKTVGVLSIIVLIRTFLSFTLDVEITGRWPWQK